MITDQETNFVYFSEKLKVKYPTSAKKIADILIKHNVNYDFLKGTKDIWCRDYMPIQINDYEFVQFKYEPSYLANLDDIRTIPETVCYKNYFEPKFNDINIDGGNVIKNRDTVILTDRIYSENPSIDQNELLKQLSDIFNSKIIVIPTFTEDTFGHADGSIRFDNNNSVIVSDLSNEYKYFKDPILKITKENNFKIHELPRFDDKKINSKYKENAIGIYLNYLEIDNLIIFPIFEIEGNKDKKAISKIKEVFPNKIIEPIEINEIAFQGGLMNCISWNIKKPKDIIKPTPLHLVKDVINNTKKDDWNKLFDLIPKLSGNRPTEHEVDFIQCIYDLNIVINFDWMNWNEGKAIFDSPDFDISKCSVVDLCKFMTVFTRNDRFSQGFLTSEIENGKVLKVIKRLQFLVEKG